MSFRRRGGAGAVPEAVSSGAREELKPKSVFPRALTAAAARRAVFLAAFIACVFWAVGGIGDDISEEQRRLASSVELSSGGESALREAAEEARAQGNAARDRGNAEEKKSQQQRGDAVVTGGQTAAAIVADVESRGIVPAAKAKEHGACPAGSRLPSADSSFLHSMFARLSNDPTHAHLSPRVISTGGPTSADPPWVLVLDDFLSTEEGDAVMVHLTDEDGRTKFAISPLNGKREGNFDLRRSESWVCDGPCMDEPWIRPLVQRMTQSIGLDRKYSQGMTLTRYGEGGFFARHHDYIPRNAEPAKWENCGNRILTFLVYLNDVVEGGATSFFNLGLDVEPRAGRALLFPNVFADRPRFADMRMAHEAKIVEGGEKYIAQTWFFYYDFQANKAGGCC